MHDIIFFNRYTNSLETESVYGEKWLSWTYNTLPGKLLLSLAVKRFLFSKWYGFRMNRPKSKSKILPFIKKYNLNPNEFLLPPDNFKNFNEFFYRKLKPEARPIHDGVIFPGDGRHLGFQNINKVSSIFIKGQRFNLQTLLNGDSSKINQYLGGSAVISRLCPVDYHRFHFPYHGTPSSPQYINGPLYSVNPLALRQNINYLFENKRVITELKTKDLGTILCIEIGATCVGSIRQTYIKNSPIKKGDEKGYFEFGGSSLITLFEPNKVLLANDLLESTHKGYELYAKFGDTMASKLN